MPMDHELRLVNYNYVSLYDLTLKNHVFKRLGTGYLISGGGAKVDAKTKDF